MENQEKEDPHQKKRTKRKRRQRQKSRNLRRNEKKRQRKLEAINNLSREKMSRDEVIGTAASLPDAREITLPAVLPQVAKAVIDRRYIEISEVRKL